VTPHSTYLPPHLAALFAHARTDFRPLRSLAAQEIERLIDFLDALDGDTDLEADQYAYEVDAEGRIALRGLSCDDEDEGDEEPSLGSIGGTARTLRTFPKWSGGASADLEADNADSEPSLGSLGGTAAGCDLSGQATWAAGPRDDRERDAGDEPEIGEDDEPSLCGLYVSAPSAGGDDREDGDDNGIADEGGRAEQFGHVWFGSIQELSSIDGRPLCWRDGRLVSEAFA
jgi:hypothetical protein